MFIADATWEFCKALPKVELHAHLNGSIRHSTLRELAAIHGLEHELDTLGLGPQTLPRNADFAPRSLAECFRLFDVIHKVTTTAAIITRITREVVEDFAADGCVYLELRTTPKARQENGLTKRSYITAVLEGLDEYYRSASLSENKNKNTIDVRLLLSVDRREDSIAAAETVSLALEFAAKKQQGVCRIVGIDLGGNPAVGQWEQWQDAFDAAHAGGLKVTLHCAEVWNEEESRKMVEWGPDRLGHMCCMSSHVRELLIKSKIPVEICISSNICTCSVESHEQHHCGPLFIEGHPIVLSTDDPLVFDTSLSREYALASHAFGWSYNQLAAVAIAAADAVFLPEKEKVKLKQEIADKAHALLSTT